MEAKVNRPDYLYKYCSAHRAAQMLRDLTVFLALAKDQNDLFEFRARSFYTVDAESKYRIYAKNLVASGACASFDEGLSLAKNSPDEEVDAAYTDIMDTLNTNLDLFMDHSRMTCFSERRNGQRLWASYGDNHAGACIEFSTDPNDWSLAKHLARVLYRKSKLPICPSVLMQTETAKLEVDIITLMFCVKHADWEDEQEWRLVRLASQEEPRDEWIARVERSAIKRVFLGPRISAEAEAGVREAAAKLTPEVPVFKRAIDEREAQEQHVGFEIITSLEQLRYWGGIRPKN